MSNQYTPQEQQYYTQLFNLIDKESVGLLTGDASINFLLASKLPQNVLGEIWGLADPNNTGYLTKSGWWKACRLIGWAQSGSEPTEELGVRSGPFPKFEGYPPPPPSTPAASSFMSPQNTGASSAQAQINPPLTPADRAQFTRVFVGCEPEGGLVSGSKAQGIFMKSKLPVDKLAQIWNLADTQQRGSLDLPDFIIGMYYIQATMSSSLSALPATLPAGMYELASGGRPRPSAMPTSPITRQMTGSPARQMSGSGILQPQRTGPLNQPTGLGRASPVPAPPPPRQLAGAFGNAFRGTPPPPQPAWDVSAQDKVNSDGFFDGLDTSRRGYIEGDVAGAFMLQSGLDESTLAQVWDLADIRKEGQLSKDEFAVAMFLINGKLAGKDLPATLPMSTIPPSLRGHPGVAQPEQSQGPQKDLFDLFSDSPPATSPAPTQTYFNTPPQQARSPPPPVPTSSQGSAFQSANSGFGGGGGFGMAPFAPAPKPVGDLMGDDDDSPAAVARVPDNSADIGNAQNSLNSTSKALDGLKTEREGLETAATSSSAQLHELEMRLSSVRAQHETETRLVKDLKSRIAEQKTSLATLRTDLIRNESELSAMRAEKDEMEQALLSDKEEVRNIGKRMKEVTEEMNTMRGVLEKMKKEARQQKGMVAISKKQVSTLEGQKDAVQKEMDDVAAGSKEEVEESPFHGVTSAVSTAAAIPLPVTPQRALSPAVTGGSLKSNNPFDRLGFGNRSVVAPVDSPSLPSSSPEIQSQGEKEGVSNLAKTAIGVGGLAVAGVLAAGTAIGAAALTAGTAVAAAVTSPSEESVPATVEPTAQTASAPESANVDPFGVSSSAPHEVEETPTPSAPEESDPFGMSAFAKPDVAAPQSNGFDNGFGDDFSSGFDAPVATQGSGTQPTQAMHLAPATEPKDDFDDAFNDLEDVPAVSDAGLVAPGMAERTISTQAMPPSTVHTPGTETLSSGAVTPQAFFDDQEPAPPIEAPTVDEPRATTPTQSANQSSLQAFDSSDDEDEAPEDLDNARSPFTTADRSTGSHQAESTADDTAPVAPIPMVVSAPSVGSDRNSLDSQEEPRITPFPAPIAAISPTPSAPTTRREPPPPPISGTSVSSPAQDNNPFSMGSILPIAPGQLSAGSKQPSASSFDDDFDFEDLPAAQAESSNQKLSGAHAAEPSKTSSGLDDFDAEFDDFGPDFEMVDATPNQGSKGAGEEISQGGSGFGGLDEWATRPSVGVNQQAPQPSTFSFDDAFGNFGSTQPLNQQSYAPPTVPPHASAPEGTRPSIPARQPTAKGAQSDDLPDVKKLCGMGFDRDLVIQALEANDYSFQKTLNVLLPGN